MAQYLTFLVNDEYYAMELSDINEIIGIMSMSRFSNRSGCIAGTVDLMGKELPVMSLKKILYKEAGADISQYILITDMGEMRVGLAVDKVDEVIVLCDGRDLPEYLTILNKIDLFSPKHLREIQHIERRSKPRKKIHLGHFYKPVARGRI